MIKLFYFLLWHFKYAPLLIRMACNQKKSQVVIDCGNLILGRAHTNVYTKPLDDFVAETVAAAYITRAEEKNTSSPVLDYQKALSLFLRTFGWQAKEKNARQISILCRIACCYFRLEEYEKATAVLTELCSVSRNKKDVLRKLCDLSGRAKDITNVQAEADSLVKELLFDN